MVPPATKARQAGASAEREGVLRESAARLRGLLEAGGLDPVALVGVSRELRATVGELHQLVELSQRSVTDETEHAAAERTRAKLQRLAQLEAAQRAARLAALPEHERAIVQRFLASPGLVVVPSLEAADG